MRDAWPIIIANACAFAMALTVLVMKWRFDPARRARPE
jgi:hypothetical protein